ncbi:MAG: hypothetical protein Q4B68_06660 [Bacteroidales bacterium]|nr:hypothetical protein [Bacteroidales bacterium]
MKPLFTILIAAALCLGLHARTKTSSHKLSSAKAEVETIATDTTHIPDGVDPKAITIKGYTKKASDSKESFFVTNNTHHRISHIKLRLRYTTVEGDLLHERVATVAVSLKPGETRLATLRSWDVQRQFYYYAGTKPRKTATPYKIAYRLIGYSIPVGAE